MNKTSSHRAQLWIGKHAAIIAAATNFIQQLFCPTGDNDDCFCLVCTQIARRQYANLLWLEPSPQYTVKEIDIILAQTRFMRDTTQPFIIVLEAVEKLTRSCANRLLKVIEEPKPGYRFIFLTVNPAAVLPTIRSRCAITYLPSTKQDSIDNPLIDHLLTMQNKPDPLSFESLLIQEAPDHIQSRLLADELHAALHQQLQASCAQHNNTPAVKLIAQKQETLKKLLRYPPQAGSSMLFWKTVFLHFAHACNSQ